MANQATARDRIASALDAENWLAPVVRQEILKFDWQSLDEAVVNSYLTEFLAGSARRVRVVFGQSAAFNEIVRKYAHPGQLECELPVDPEGDFARRLMSYASTVPHDPFLTGYLQFNLAAIGDAYDLFHSDAATLDAITIGKVTESALLDLAEGLKSAALQRFAAFLDLRAIDASLDPAELVQRINIRIGSDRGMVRSGFFAHLATALNASGLRRHVLAVVDKYFDDESSCCDAARRHVAVASLVERLRAFESRAESADFAQQQLSSVIRLWHCLIEQSEWASRALIASDSPESLSLAERQWVLLDAVVGWIPGERFDPAQIDFLIGYCVQKPLLGCLDIWVLSLQRRGLLEGFCDELVAEQQCRSTGDFSAGAWWQAPCAIGRTAVLSALTEFLSEHYSPELGLSLLGACTGIAADLELKIAAIAAAAPDPASRRVAILLAFGVMFHGVPAGDFARKQLFIETILRIDGKDGYANERFRKQCKEVFDSALPGMRLEQAFYCSLVVPLVRQGFLSAAILVVKAICGGLPSDADFDFSRIEVVAEVDPAARDTMMGSLILLMDSLSRLPVLRPMLQQHLGLPEILGATDEELSEALMKYVTADDGKIIVARVEPVSSLARAFEETGDVETAVRILECTVGIVGCRNEDLAGCFRHDRGPAWAYIASLGADMLLGRGKADRFLAILDVVCERYSDGSTNWLSVTRLREVEALDHWTCRDHELALMGKAMAGLRMVGRQAEAIRGIRSELMSLDWMECGVDGRGSDGAIILAAECALLLIDEDPEFIARLHGKLLPLVGDVYGYGRTAAFDRLAGAGRSTQARHLMINIGNSLAVVAEQEAGRSLRIDNLMIEAVLAQQLIMMRYLQGRPAMAIGEGPMLQTGRRAWKSILRKKAGATGTGHESEVTAIGQLRSDAPAIEHEIIVRERVFYETDGQASWQEQISEHVLASTIRPKQLLLRAGFTLQGQLVWSLFRSDGLQLSVAAHSGNSGSRDDRDNIAKAVARFDRQLDCIWDLFEAAEHSRLEDCDWLQQLIGLLRNDTDFRPVDTELQNRIIEPLERFPRTQARLIAAFGRPQSWGKKSQTPENATWASWWKDTIDIFDAVTSSATDLRQQLDSATNGLLETLESIWPLHRLCPVLKSTDELMVWAEDILLSLPLAFLQHRDTSGTKRHLFEYVDSMQIIISPLLDSWMREREWDRRTATDPVIASLSWFTAQTSAEESTEIQLAQLFSRLEKRFGNQFEWRASGTATDIPANHDVLANSLKSLDDKAIALLAVCGHGCESPRGVQLGDGVWDGSEVWSEVDDDNHWKVRGACELSAVDFIIQLSCSIGRLDQKGFQDVTGFCTELFLNRARSIFAGRWPLHSAEAIAFSSWVARAYLKRYAALPVGQSFAQGRVRGRAVAAARGHWAELFRRGEAPFGLYTAASMDLYGLP